MRALLVLGALLAAFTGCLCGSNQGEPCKLRPTLSCKHCPDCVNSVCTPDEGDDGGSAIGTCRIPCKSTVDCPFECNSCVGGFCADKNPENECKTASSCRFLGKCGEVIDCSVCAPACALLCAKDGGG